MHKLFHPRQDVYILCCMDELIIEDKKYVSSKRAAKITGYAKDYVGQLCREGRVSARLVGRNWYVLESAIQDHRFGMPTESPSLAPPPTWEAPRYEASEPVELPIINRLPITDDVPIENVDDKQSIPYAWQSWFDQIAEITPKQNIGAEEEPVEKADEPLETSMPEEVPTPDVPVEEQGEEIKIHTIYELPPESLLPHSGDQGPEVGETHQQISHTRAVRAPRGVYALLRGVAIVIAVGSASLAVIASGFVDRYLISVNQASIITGISTYNK